MSDFDRFNSVFAQYLSGCVVVMKPIDTGDMPAVMQAASICAKHGDRCVAIPVFLHAFGPCHSYITPIVDGFEVLDGKVMMRRHWNESDPESWDDRWSDAVLVAVKQLQVELELVLT